MPVIGVTDSRHTISFKANNVQLHNLKPTKSALKQQIYWANYQAAVCKGSLMVEQQLSSPDSQQEKISGTAHWADLSPAYDIILELVSCGWTRNGLTRRCDCNNNLPSSDAYLCGEQFWYQQSSILSGVQHYGTLGDLAHGLTRGT
ncbi:hypothetical protein SK128_016732 [Halocaridina rubra]|uniref:Uncharacterized protein n=1 Tax=Halocaridina rubra TaxID=373956 RepID=A0AAN9AD38_HALRR